MTSYYDSKKEWNILWLILKILWSIIDVVTVCLKHPTDMRLRPLCTCQLFRSYWWKYRVMNQNIISYLTLGRSESIWRKKLDLTPNVLRPSVLNVWLIILKSNQSSLSFQSSSLGSILTQKSKVCDLPLPTFCSSQKNIQNQKDVIVRKLWEGGC